jgi:hypothetical protein
MNRLNKYLAIAVVTGAGLVASATTSASSLAVLPEAGALATRATYWIVGELGSYIAKALSSSRATQPTRAPSVTIVADNHMVVEARRLSPETQPFRGLSGPRKKQTLP